MVGLLDVTLNTMVKVRSLESVQFLRYIYIYIYFNVLHIRDIQVIPT